MIELKSISIRNFLSFGNAWTKLDFQNGVSIIEGRNGSGKSSIVDALCFGLFGLTLRKCPKNQLVNRRTNKDCIVEIELVCNGKQVSISRGIKPNVFLVTVNGRCVDSAGDRDLQEWLESCVLRMNFNVFSQNITISRTRYKGYMQMSLQEQRHYIEDLFGLDSLVSAQRKAKEISNDVGEELRNIDRAIDSAEIRIDTIENILGNDTRINELKEQLPEKSVFAKLIQDRNDTRGKVESTKSDIREVERDVYILNSRLKQLHDGNCPLCQRALDAGMEHKIKEWNTELGNKKSILEEKQGEQKELEEKLQELGYRIKRIDDIMRKIQHLKQEAEQNNNREQVNELLVEVKLLVQQREIAEQKRIDLVELEYLLSDDGIRYRILNNKLKQFIPLVNQYLDKLGLFVRVEADEDLDINFYARGFEKAPYNSFSEGERAKIDFAMLFAWTTLASHNDAACNVMFIDEIVDACLDDESVETIFGLLSSLNSCIMVITHSGARVPTDVNHIRVVKENGFSRIVKVDA